jgi:type IV secretory pathway VirB2 component (pilin)
MKARRCILKPVRGNSRGAMAVVGLAVGGIASAGGSQQLKDDD